ncbi:MAG: hypothetical protein WAK18_17405 [Nocardioidaceae bacterium]
MVETPEPESADTTDRASEQPSRSAPDTTTTVSAQEAPAQDTPPPPAPDSSGLTLVDVRRLWPGVLERVKRMKRYAWILLSQNAQVKDVSDGVLTIGFGGEGAAKNFRTGGAAEILRQALIDELGVDWRVEGIIDGPSPQAPSRTVREPESRPAAAPVESRKPPAEPEPSPPAAASAGVESGDAGPPPDRSANVDAAKGAIRKTRNGREAGQPEGADEPPEVHEDDDVVDDASLSSHELLERELGAQVIDDIRHDGR